MTLRIGILSFAHLHAAGYAATVAAHPGAEFVGLWDANAERAGKMAAQFGVPAFSSPKALLEMSLDGVIVTSENIFHRELVELAAEAGVRAILCEKPLATTSADAQAMIDCCASRNVFLSTAFPCRYSPIFQRGMARIQSGEIGEVLALRGTNRGMMPGGWFTETPLSGGGAVIDHAVHVADLNRLLLGREATNVYAEIGSGFFGQSWDDTGFLTIAYDDGIFATLDTSWSRPKTFPTWGDVTLQAVGTKGVLDMDLFAQTLTHYGDRAGRIAWPNWGSSLDAGLIDDFLRAARGEATPMLATGTDGLRALEVALAAYASAKAGSPAPIR